MNNNITTATKTSIRAGSINDSYPFNSKTNLTTLTTTATPIAGYMNDKVVTLKLK
jgi:hypothetical protein